MVSKKLILIQLTQNLRTLKNFSLFAYTPHPFHLHLCILTSCRKQMQASLLLRSSLLLLLLLESLETTRLSVLHLGTSHLV